MKLVCYAIHDPPPVIRPAPLERPWMDATPQGFAYRCLPLNIANAHGWEVLSPVSFSAEWNGGQAKDCIRISSTGAAHLLPVSHFGSGVLTFHMGALFRTEPHVQLWASGPINRPKDGIQPLTGIIETDWAPFTFTMNWIFTRAFQRISFKEGEPFCHIFPLNLDMVEAVEPELLKIDDDPELAAAYRGWEASRNTFNQDLAREGSQAQADGWQKTYFRGRELDGTPAPVKHRTKVRVRPFGEP